MFQRWNTEIFDKKFLWSVELPPFIVIQPLLSRLVGPYSNATHPTTPLIPLIASQNHSDEREMATNEEEVEVKPNGWRGDWREGG